MPAASVAISTDGPALANGNDASHMNGGTDGLSTSGKVLFQTGLTLSLPAKVTLSGALPRWSHIYVAGQVNQTSQSCLHDPSLLDAIERIQSEAAPLQEHHLPFEEVLAKRRAHIGPGTTLNYRKPLHIVRGEGCRLYDADDVEYLDCVNNVAHVGHCNPKVGFKLAASIHTALLSPCASCSWNAHGEIWCPT